MGFYTLLIEDSGKATLATPKQITPAIQAGMTARAKAAILPLKAVLDNDNII